MVASADPTADRCIPEIAEASYRKARRFLLDDDDIHHRLARQTGVSTNSIFRVIALLRTGWFDENSW
jgi:hypothetical protein